MDSTTLRNICLAIAAIIMATEQALKGAPTFRDKLPQFLASEYWNFVPILFLSIAGLIWVFRQIAPPAPISISTEGATPQQSAGSSQSGTVASTFIKPDDQLYVGNKLAGERDLKCTARIIRCPSTECDDDAKAMWATLAIGKWQQPEMPTSDNWERLNAEANAQVLQKLIPAQVVLHEAVYDPCGHVSRQ